MICLVVTILSNDEHQEISRVVNFNLGNTNDAFAPVFPFNCLFDTDLGLVQLIKYNYASPDVFDRDLFSQFDSKRAMIRLLYTRKNVNPLLYFMKDKTDIELANNIYAQFYAQKYDEILDYCVYTGLYELIIRLANEGDIHPIILYSNEPEKIIVESNMDFRGIKGYDVNDNDTFDILKRYKQFFFISNYDGMYLPKLLKILLVKSIYILDYGYNFDKEGHLIINNNLDILLNTNRCQLSIIDVYDRKRLGFSTINEDNKNDK